MNTEYTKYDPPSAQVSDDALAQKYLLYTPPARLKLRYRELDDENTTTYGRISSQIDLLSLSLSSLTEKAVAGCPFLPHL